MKRRVIAIAVVLAALGVVALNWNTLWQLAMYERVVQKHPDGAGYTIFHMPRYGDQRDVLGGVVWFHRPGSHTMCTVTETVGGESVVGYVATEWDAAGKIFRQRVSSGGQGYENIWDPPWLPHPPLIDLREFEE